MKPAVRLSSAIFLLGIIALITLYTQPSFAHGVGGETLPPVQIGSKNATLSLYVNPPTYDPQTGEYEILLKLYETNTQAIIPHVTYLIQMSKDGKQLFSERFHDESSNLSIKVSPKNTDRINIQGNNMGDLGWTKNTDLFPLKIEGPIFLTGGLYKFHIEVLTIDSDSNKLNPPVQFDAAISLAETATYLVTYQKNNYQIGIMSYYDKIENFAFDADARTISFSMPYEWSQKNISQTTVVHQEIHIPKTFAEMLVTKYDATVNGIPLPEDAVTIDDYTTDNRIVHLVLNQKVLYDIVGSITDTSKMTFTITPSNEEKFPLSAYSHNAIFEIGLSWDPAPIHPNQSTRFYVDITRYFATKVQEDAKFDLIVSQHGKELYRKSVDGKIGAEEKTNYFDYTFSDKNLGPAIVSIEKINGEELSSADFVVVVSPESKKTFPIRMQSATPDGAKGNYNVDLTWIPENLQPGEAEFIITVYDQNLQPVQNAEYDFVLIQNGQEIQRKSHVASAGGSFEDVTFFEANRGPMTLKIENINKSGESVELPITVTPEFPLGWLIVLGVVFSGLVVIPRIKSGQILPGPF